MLRPFYSDKDLNNEFGGGSEETVVFLAPHGMESRESQQPSFTAMRGTCRTRNFIQSCPPDHRREKYP